MPSNHLILCCPLLLPSIFPSLKVFSNELAFCIRWPKYWSFSFNISPSIEYSGLISFRIDWFDLLAVQKDSQESFPTPQFKSINYSALSFLYGTNLTLIHNRLDKTDQTFDKTWNNHKQHKYGITRTSRGISQLQIPITRMAQIPPCSGIRRSSSCLFWSTIPTKLCWLFRAVLRNLTSRFWGCSLEWHSFSSVQSVAQSCPTLCEPMNHSTPGLPVHHQLPEFIQIHVP